MAFLKLWQACKAAHPDVTEVKLTKHETEDKMKRDLAIERMLSTALKVRLLSITAHTAGGDCSAGMTQYMT